MNSDKFTLGGVSDALQIGLRELRIVAWARGRHNCMATEPPFPLRIDASPTYAFRARGIRTSRPGCLSRAYRTSYPKSSTSAPFSKKLQLLICRSSIPFLALVDADAYGLDILSVYKFGSNSMAHERHQLTAPRIEWIGIKGSELKRFDGLDLARGSHCSSRNLNPKF